MRTITAVVDDKYVEALDALIKATGLYSSRSELIKDAVRGKIVELKEYEEALKRVRKAAQKAKGAYSYKGELTRAKKDALARKYR